MMELNCDVCRNRNTYKCDACIHNEDVLLEDHFEACPETLAKLEQERIEQVQKAAIKEWIAVPTLSDAFRSIFATAKKLQPRRISRLALLESLWQMGNSWLQTHMRYW